MNQLTLFDDQGQTTYHSQAQNTSNPMKEEYEELRKIPLRCLQDYDQHLKLRVLYLEGFFKKAHNT